MSIPKHRNKYFTNDGGLFCWWWFLPSVLYFWSWVSFLSVTAEGEVSSSRRMKHYLLSPSLVSQGWKESRPNVRYKKRLLLSSLIQWARVQANYVQAKCCKLFSSPVSSSIRLFPVNLSLKSFVALGLVSTVAWFFLTNALEIYAREWSRGNMWKATRKREAERGSNFTFTRDLPYSLYYLRA